MYALTVRQPWAWLIIEHPHLVRRCRRRRGEPVKRVENRPWRTAYRGPLAIHAGKAPPSQGAYAWCTWVGIELPNMDEMVYRAVLGTVELVDVWRPIDRAGRDEARSPHAWGEWCWELAEPTPLAEPVAMGGRQGLWHLDPAELGLAMA